MEILQIYDQPFQHEEVYIIGNKEGLLKLREAIDQALNSEDNVGVSLAFVSDGEGYNLVVIENNEESTSEYWNKLKLPYTVEYLKNVGLHPYEIMTEDQKAKVIQFYEDTDGG